MVRDDIFGGLQFALERGESLEKAMMSFYNAGYPKKDIEEAASALQMQKTQQMQIQQQSQQVMQTQKTAQQMQNNSQFQQSQEIQQKHQKNKYGVPKQNVSNYGNQKPPVLRIVLIAILGFILVLLLGALVGIFAFKSLLIEFFNKLLG